MRFPPSIHRGLFDTKGAGQVEARALSCPSTALCERPLRRPSLFVCEAKEVHHTPSGRVSSAAPKTRPAVHLPSSLPRQYAERQLKLPPYQDRRTLEEKLLYAITADCGFELS